MRGMLTVFFIVIVVLIVVALAVALKDSGTLVKNVTNSVTNSSVTDVIDTNSLNVQGVTDVLNGIPTLESELAQPELDINIDL